MGVPICLYTDGKLSASVNLRQNGSEFQAEVVRAAPKVQVTIGQPVISHADGVQTRPYLLVAPLTEPEDPEDRVTKQDLIDLMDGIARLLEAQRESMLLNQIFAMQKQSWDHLVNSMQRDDFQRQLRDLQADMNFYVYGNLSY